jgi:Pyruvate/2-oxoacid:ferredoxin oxidoreductase delta subunit
MSTNGICEAGTSASSGEYRVRVTAPRRRALPLVSPRANAARTAPPSKFTAAATAAWFIGQASALAALAAITAGLWLAPSLALRVLWGGLVPLLPTMLLIHPGLWRNICPLATLNMLVASRHGTRKLSPQAGLTTGNVGIALVFLLIPARRLLLNTDATATAALLGAMGVTAIILGIFFERKAGYCNAICPMLPIERLYGQAPLLEVGNRRCDGCSVCTARGCLDLAPRKSIAQMLGPSRRSVAWLRRPFGMFAAAFPGVALGYFLAPGATPGAALTVYLTVMGCAAASYVLGVAAVLALRLSARAAMTGFAATAIGIFYWFSAAQVTMIWSLAAGAVWAIRGLALLLIALWISHRVRRAV